MSATETYEAAVHARGWVFLLQLPPNTPLGQSASGRPGARSPWSATGSTYELAPLAVQIEQGYKQLVDAAVLADAPSEIALGQWFEDTITHPLSDAASAIGLDQGVGGLLAKVLGIPPWLLLIIALIILWAVLQQYKLVPSFKKVIT